MDHFDSNVSADRDLNTFRNLSEYDFPINLTTMQKSSIWVAFSFLTLIGCIANAFMLIILRRMKSTFFTVILVGLCFSDLISSLNSPIYVYGYLHSYDYYKRWWIFCYLSFATEIATSAVTAHHVFLLSLIRFRSITRIGGSTKEISMNRSRVYVVLSYMLLRS